jgi:hypothetical protein
MRSLLLLLLALPALGLCQSPGVTDTQFSPQGFAIGPYQEYLAVICNQSETALAVNSGQVVNAARAHAISLVGYERVEKAEAASSRVTAWTWGRRIVQAGAAGFLLCDQSGLCKIGNEEHPARWKVAIPIVGIVLPQVVSWVTTNTPKSEMAPENQRVPAFFQVPGRSGTTPGCVQFTVYGWAVP